MNTADILKLKIKTEIVRRYYVESDGWIYGGPFDSKEEAQKCIRDAMQIDSEHPLQ